MMRALIHYKVKSDAEIWLYSSTSATMETADKMISHLEKMFVMSKESKLSMRQKLQNCVWIKREEFSKYYNEKWQLADNLALADDEFLEYVIDGIYDVNLRNLPMSRSFKTGAQFTRRP
ncbi:GM11952 [Drosophila sechellia]|uniref:GM11952 n=1 Tax=Drosophila sechellia TaxID=7238 RepID=B4IM20_DROSE|nr:GM11952 [Drosophila sechellia]